MKEYRCLSCNKLLFKGRLILVEIKCPRCGRLQTLKAVELHAPKEGYKKCL